MKHLRTILLSIIAVAAVIGVVASVYSLLAHYDVASSEFCSINETFDCDIVNKSKYSRVLGIPVGVLGILGFGFFIPAPLIYAKRKDPRLMNVMLFGATLAMLFSLYLTYIEAFVLYTWCMICLTSLFATIALNVGVFGLHWYESKQQ